jgi:hypothetical protein
MERELCPLHVALALRLDVVRRGRRDREVEQRERSREVAPVVGDPRLECEADRALAIARIERGDCLQLARGVGELTGLGQRVGQVEPRR